MNAATSLLCRRAFAQARTSTLQAIMCREPIHCALSDMCCDCRTHRELPDLTQSNPCADVVYYHFIIVFRTQDSGRHCTKRLPVVTLQSSKSSSLLVQTWRPLMYATPIDHSACHVSLNSDDEYFQFYIFWNCLRVRCCTVAWASLGLSSETAALCG